VDTITALAFSAAVFCRFHQAGLSYFSVEDLQVHSLRIATLAKAIAHSQRLPQSSIEEALLAGLLHDVGKLVLVSNKPAQYDQCIGDSIATGEPLWSAESRLFGITHAEAGMYLLRLWGLPDIVTEVVALHHRPQDGAGTSLGPLSAVYIADTLVHGDGDSSTLDGDYLARLGVASRVPDWRRLCRQLAED
jgi:putative nucleotidyltransferase with HDIG domain